MYYTNFLENSSFTHSSNIINYEKIKNIGEQWDVMEPTQIKLT
jgi:hypothetical protein